MSITEQHLLKAIELKESIEHQIDDLEYQLSEVENEVLRLQLLLKKENEAESPEFQVREFLSKARSLTGAELEVCEQILAGEWSDKLRKRLRVMLQNHTCELIFN